TTAGAGGCGVVLPVTAAAAADAARRQTGTRAPSRMNPPCKKALGYACPGAHTSRPLDRVDDLFRKALPLPEVLAAVGVVLRDELVVLVEPPLPLVQRLRLEIIGVVELGDFGGHEVAEVGVALPLDRPLRDRLHDRRGVLDADLLRALVLVGAADPPRVHELDLHRARLHQLGHPVAPTSVQQRAG